jgi:predicted membrane protein
MSKEINSILISTLIYISLMVILGVGVYKITEGWYLNLVCPLLASVITTIWGVLSLDWYDDMKNLNQNKDEDK